MCPDPQFGVFRSRATVLATVARPSFRATHVACNFVRSGGNFSRDLDMLASLELDAQGSNLVKQSNPTFGVCTFGPVFTN